MCSALALGHRVLQRRLRAQCFCETKSARGERGARLPAIGATPGLAKQRLDQHEKMYMQRLSIPNGASLFFPGLGPEAE